MKPMLFILLALLLTSAAKGQDYPKVEVYTGYSYVNIKPSFDQERESLNGWDCNIALNLISAFGIAADVSGHYGHVNGENVRMHTVLFGPRFAYHSKRAVFYVHNLYGISHISGDGSLLTPLIGTKSVSSFAFVPGGGGIEIKINKKLAYRVFQFDLIFTSWGQKVGQMHARLSTGVVFYIGK